MFQTLLSGFSINSDAFGEIRASSDALIFAGTGGSQKLEPHRSITVRNTPGKRKYILHFLF